MNCDPFSLARKMFLGQMIPVKPHNQNAVVGVSKPPRNGGGTDSCFETLGGKVVATGVKGKPLNPCLITGGDQGFFGAVLSRVAFLEPVSFWKKESFGLTSNHKPCTEPRKKINLPCLTPLFGDGEVSCGKINILPSEGSGSLAAQTTQTEQLDKIGGFPAVGTGDTFRTTEVCEHLRNLLGCRHMDFFCVRPVSLDLGERIGPDPSTLFGEVENPAEMCHVNLGGPSGTFQFPGIEIFLELGRADFADPEMSKPLRRLVEMTLNADQGFFGHLLGHDPLLGKGYHFSNGLGESGDVLVPCDLRRSSPQGETEVEKARIGDVPDLGLEAQPPNAIVFLDYGIIPASLRPDEKVFGHSGILGHALNQHHQVDGMQGENGFSGYHFGIPHAIIGEYFSGSTRAFPRDNPPAGRAVAQLGSASALGAEGREFKSRRPDSLEILRSLR